MKKCFANIRILLAGMLLVLVLVDRVNNSMQFLEYTGTKWIMFLLCVSTLISGVTDLKGVLRAEDRKRAHARKH